MVSVIEMDRPPHKENGMALMARIERLSNQIKAHTHLPKYIAKRDMGEIATKAIQPARMSVDNGIATVFDNKNNKGN